MKTPFLMTLLALVAAGAASAQSEAFDIATFVPPAGFTRKASEGVLIFEHRRAALGRMQFCQIFLSRSRPFLNDPAVEFHRELQDVVTRLNVRNAAPAPPTTERTPDGWTVMTGRLDTVTQQGPTRVVLAAYFGSGRVVTVVVAMSPNAYVNEVGRFFQNLHLKTAGVPAATVALNSVSAPVDLPPPGSLANYVFQIPQSWAQTESSGRIVLMSPTYQTGERCQITMDPMRPATQPLPNEAAAFYRQAFRMEPMAPYANALPKLAKGTTPDGWEFFIIRKSIGGTDGDMGTMVFVAQVGGQVATIVGTGKRPLVSSCLGELVFDAWPGFFYSLKFKNAAPAGDAQAAVRERLAGTWSMATGSVGLQYVFHADGRYADTGATRRVSRVLPGELVETTQAYFGNGSYTFDGNQIILTGDDGRRSVKNFRLEQNSNDGGRTWVDGLCLLDPGASGEVCYKRTSQ